jgi:hypothetical protein
MSAIKFKHVFGALLFLSALSAFVIPEKYASAVQPQVQGLFYPVAKPVGSLARWVHGNLGARPVKDGRSTQTLLEENDSLRQEVAAMMRELDELRRRDAELETLGPLRERCTLFSVVGADAAGRDGLLLSGSTLEGLRQGQAVLFPGGIVGRIQRSPGIAGAQVRLITDRGMRMEAFCVGFTRDAAGATKREQVPIPPIIVEGIGQGAMRCATALTMEEVNVAKLKEGDMVFLDKDDEWDKAVHFRRLGKIVRIERQAASRLHAEIRIEPTSTLLGLQEVMVMTKSAE